jgi:hypothetical protein
MPLVSISRQRRLRCLALTVLGEPLALLFFDRCIQLRVSGGISCRFWPLRGLCGMTRDLTFVESVESAQRECNEFPVLRSLAADS